MMLKLMERGTPGLQETQLGAVLLPGLRSCITCGLATREKGPKVQDTLAAQPTGLATTL